MTWITWAYVFHLREDGHRKTLCNTTPSSRFVKWPAGEDKSSAPPEVRQCLNCRRKLGKPRTAAAERPGAEQSTVLGRG